MIVSTNKYGATKMVVDGITFDSRKEARRYTELKLLERTGKITDLQRQVKFKLIPAQYAQSAEVYTRGPTKGQHKQGRCIEQPVSYIADFVYVENGRKVIEDTKGMRTKDYIIKRKLVRWIYGKEYEFREV